MWNTVPPTQKIERRILAARVPWDFCSILRIVPDLYIEVSTLKVVKQEQSFAKLSFQEGKNPLLLSTLTFAFSLFSPTVHSETMTWWMSVDCNPFIPCGGGNREPGISFGLSEPESLWTEPPLPSNWEIFFLIIFLSLALRFWNQIFTCNVISYVWSV